MTNKLPEAAYTEGGAFEAKTAMWSQTKDGLIRLSFLVLPGDVPAWVYQLTPGSHVAVGLRVFDHDGSLPDKTPNKDVQRAALLCKNPRFQKYMAWVANEKDLPSYYQTESDSEDGCRDILCAVLGIDSRSELASDGQTAEKFRILCGDFEKRAAAGKF